MSRKSKKKTAVRPLWQEPWITRRYVRVERHDYRNLMRWLFFAMQDEFFHHLVFTDDHPELEPHRTGGHYYEGFRVTGMCTPGTDDDEGTGRVQLTHGHEHLSFELSGLRSIELAPPTGGQQTVYVAAEKWDAVAAEAVKSQEVHRGCCFDRCAEVPFEHSRFGRWLVERLRQNGTRRVYHPAIHGDNNVILRQVAA